jgi:hypothetical protein
VKSVRCIAVAVVAVALMARAPAAAAPGDENKAQARALLVEGSRHLQQGNYAEALAKFEKAYELVPSPKIQYNFGLAYVGLDRPSDALRAFEAFLADACDAPAANLAKAREYVGRLSRRVAVLQLEGDLAGTEVSVDGRSFGQTARVLVDPGPHVVTVDRRGEAPFLQRLTASAGERLKIEVKRAPPPESAPPVATTETPPAKLPKVSAPPPETRAAPPERPSERAWQRPAGYFAAGLAGALVVGGVGARLVANQKYQDFNDLTDGSVNICGRAAPDKGGLDCQRLLSSGDDWSRLALVGFIGAGAAAVASVVLFFTAPSGKPEVSLACAPDVGLRGAACQLRF